MSPQLATIIFWFVVGYFITKYMILADDDTDDTTTSDNQSQQARNDAYLAGGDPKDS